MGCDSGARRQGDVLDRGNPLRCIPETYRTITRAVANSSIHREGTIRVTGNSQAFEFHDFGNYSLLVLLPPLNDEWSQVEEYAKDLLAQVENSQSPRLVLDLNSLDYCGSAVVALMVRVWKNVQERRGAMEVSCSSEIVRQVLATARLTDIWKLHPRREDAARALGVDRGRSFGSPARRGAALLFVLALLYGGAAALAVPEGLRILPILSGVAAVLYLALAFGVFVGSRPLTVISRVWVAFVFCISLVVLGLVAGKVSWAEFTGGQKALAVVVAVLGLGVYWFTWITLERVGQTMPLGLKSSAPEDRLRAVPQPAATPGAAPVEESSKPETSEAG